VNADSLLLDDRAGIVAITEFGNGGNIELQIENDILLKNQSQISTTANQIGQGGNIAIDTTLLTALNNSDITANAGDSFGGQIAIAAQGVFGTEIRDSLTPQSDITATSKLGAEFDGVVEIDLSNADPIGETIELPTGFINAKQEIVSSCQIGRDNTFVVTGKGGIAPSPQEYLRGQNILQDWRLSMDNGQLIIDNEQLSTNNEPSAILEAERWIVNQKGIVELVASSGTSDRLWLNAMKCSA
ncbi:MAG: S-layer family protein, partial [Cyanobacteria bacterium J06643_13]